MRIPSEYINLFESYVLGDLSEKDAADFEARLSYDSEFAESFQAYRELETGIRHHYKNTLKRRLEALDREMDEAEKRISKSSKLAWITTSIAATILIGLLVVGLLGNDKPVQLAQKYWPEEEGLPVKMSAKSTYDDAMNAFKQEHWQRTAELLQNISPQSDTAHYFLGVVYFNLQQYDNATNHLAALDQANKWYDEGQFRLALSYLAAKRKDQSRIVLQRIASSSSVYKDKATALLQEM